jgi:hypothetical protein
MQLPNSPVRKIHECRKCGDVSLKFWNPSLDRVYTKEEWETVKIEGKEALIKILKPLKDTPIFFLE